MQAPQQALPQGHPSGPITPHTDVATGGIGSMLLFNEDASLGPEPMLFNHRGNNNGFVRNPASSDDPTVMRSPSLQPPDNSAARCM